MAFIERHDLLHAAHAELFPLSLGDVVSRHLRISPAEHRHHLALSAVGVGRDLGARLANAVAALLRFVDAGQDCVLLELRRPRLLLHRQHAAFHDLAGKDLRAEDPGCARRPQAFRKLRMHRHRNNGVASAFLGFDLHHDLANDLAQMGLSEAMRVANPQECVVQDSNISRASVPSGHFAR
jgi:hypothetical protein